MTVRLITVSPESVVAFCLAHPVDMRDRYKDVTRRGGDGDKRPPTPAAEVFFWLYLEDKRGELPTQEEYKAACRRVWADWYTHMLPYTQACVEARLDRNFYPSFLDSVHVCALLGTVTDAHGARLFDRCEIDTYADVITKVDVCAWQGDTCFRLALRAQTRAAAQASDWKGRYRQGRGHTDDRIEIILPMERAKVGGKRWYQWPDDFYRLLWTMEQVVQPPVGRPPTRRASSAAYTLCHL